MTIEAATAVAAGCDAECKWRQSIGALVTEKSGREQAVPTTQLLGDLSPRPTEEGYARLAAIRQDYSGLELTVSNGDHCTRACAIERLADPVNQYNLGSRILETFKDLRGDV